MDFIWNHRNCYCKSLTRKRINLLDLTNAIEIHSFLGVLKKSSSIKNSQSSRKTFAVESFFWLRCSALAWFQGKGPLIGYYCQWCLVAENSLTQLTLFKYITVNWSRVAFACLNTYLKQFENDFWLNNE